MQKTKIRTETREPEQTPEPTLERLVQETSCREREACLMELRGAIAAILQPRGGYHFYAGSNARHFLPIPTAPGIALNRAGWPDNKTVDDAELDAINGELVRITREEKRLEEAAGKAKNQIEALVKWGIRIGEAEDMLLLAGSVLSEEDRPAVESYLAEHSRFLRTVNRLTDGLRF